MMTIKKHLLFVLTILLAGLVYFSWFNYKDGLIFISGDNIIPLNPQANIKYLSTWTDNNNGTVILSSYHFVILLYSFISRLSLSLTTMQFLHVYIIHVVGALGIYYLANVLLIKHEQKKLISLMAGIVYLFTPAFLNMHFAFPAIGFVPLSLALFIDGMHKKNKYLFALAIGVVVGLGNLPDPHPRPLFLVMTPIFIYTIIEIFFSKNIKPVLSYLFLVLSYIFLFNAWYFLGFISNGLLNSNILYSAKSIPFIFGNKFPDEGTAVIEKMFRLFHDNLTIPGLLAKYYLAKWLVIFSNYSLPVLAFSSILFLNRKKMEIGKNILFLLTLAIFFLFFSKSVNPPFGVFYRLALENIPLFRFFRTTAYFILVSAISYSILIPFSIIEISNLLKKWNLISKFTAFSLFVLVMISTYPILLGYPAYYQPDPAFPAQRGLKLSKDYYSFGEFIAADPIDAKTISLPLDSGYEILMTNPRYFGIPILPYIMDKPIINQKSRDFGTDFSFPLVIENQILEKNKNSNYLLNLLNVKYITVKNNATDIIKYQTKKNIFADYRFVRSFGSYTLYENQSFLPHIYIPSRTIINEKFPEQLSEIIAENKLTDRIAFYLSAQNPAEKLSLLSSLTENYKLPTIEYKKINQTKYRVIVHNASVAFPLIFSENFHNGWKLYLSNLRKIRNVSGHKYISMSNRGTVQNDNLPDGPIFETLLKKPQADSSHLVANSFANSWIIKPFELCSGSLNCIKNPDQSYDLELLIEYLPQKMANVGYLVSMTSILVSLGYFIYVKYKQK